MRDKFTMDLVWHNCKTYPPKEESNKGLYMSNGLYVHKVFYKKDFGWFDMDLVTMIPEDRLAELWWADVEQTVHGCKEF